MIPQTTGRTAIILLLGHPVGHVRGPAVINAYLADAEIDAHVIPLDVCPDDLPGFVDQVRRIGNVAGLTITRPHKERVTGLLDSVTAQADRSGAVNWVRRDPDGTLTGENLDGTGFVHGLRAAGVEPEGRRILQIGAGGVGRAIACALAEQHEVELDIVNRDQERAIRLAGALTTVLPDARVSAPGAPSGRYSLVVNATSLGAHPDDPLPGADYDLDGTDTFADVINSPTPTPFLARAERTGATAVPGAAMLTPQLELMVEFLRLR